MEDHTQTRKEPRLVKFINAEEEEVEYSYENKAVDFRFNYSSFSDVGKKKAEDTI